MRPSSSRQPHQQLEDLRLHHHVERGRRLVGEQHLAARRRAPSRSRRAGACRPRTRAGSGRRGRRRCRPARAARRTCARAALPVAVPCSSIGSAIWLPIVFTGLNAFIAPWKTIAMSVQRCGLTRLLAARQDVLAVQASRCPATLRARGQEPHHREDRGRLAAAGLAHEPHPLARVQLEADALHGVQLAAAGEVEPDVQVLDPEDRLACSLAVQPCRAAAAAGTGAPTGGRPGAAG